MVRERLIELGYFVNTETTHEFLKARFNTIDHVTVEGEVLNFPQSTAKLKSSEFWEYIEKIIIFASTTLDIVIPAPNEQVGIDV